MRPCLLNFERLEIASIILQLIFRKGIVENLELIERKKEEMDVNMLSPLVWAYVGDSVYEMAWKVSCVWTVEYVF